MEEVLFCCDYMYVMVDEEYPVIRFKHEGCEEILTLNDDTVSGGVFSVALVAYVASWVEAVHMIWEKAYTEDYYDQ